MMRRSVSCVVLLVGIAISAGCGRRQAEDPYTPDRVANVQRALKYHKLVINPYTVDKSVEEPGTAPNDCQKATVDYLNSKRIFASVQPNGGVASDPDTLAVDVTVVAMRIVSGGARFWGGALAGSSNMTLRVVAKNSTGAVVGDRVVASDNNAMGAAWSMGASDRGLPGDMGPMVADAIIQLAQGLAAPPPAPAQ